MHNRYNVFASLLSFFSTESGISGKSGHGIVSKLSSTGNSQTFLLSNFPSGPLNDSRPEKVLGTHKFLNHVLEYHDKDGNASNQ